MFNSDNYKISPSYIGCAKKLIWKNLYATWIIIIEYNYNSKIIIFFEWNMTILRGRNNGSL